MLSFGLKATNNFASLFFFYGACKIGEDCAKQTFPLASETTNASQSLYLPIFFTSWAWSWLKLVKNKIIKNAVIFLVMDMDLGKFFEHG